MNYDRFRKDFEVEKSTRCGCKTGLQGIHQSFLPLEKRTNPLKLLDTCIHAVFNIPT